MEKDTAIGMIIACSLLALLAGVMVGTKMGEDFSISNSGPKVSEIANKPLPQRLDENFQEQVVILKELLTIPGAEKYPEFKAGVIKFMRIVGPASEDLAKCFNLLEARIAR